MARGVWQFGNGNAFPVAGLSLPAPHVSSYLKFPLPRSFSTTVVLSACDYIPNAYRQKLECGKGCNM